MIKLIYISLIFILTLLNYKLLITENFKDLDSRLNNLDLIPKLFLQESLKLNINHNVLNFFPSKIVFHYNNKSLIVSTSSIPCSFFLNSADSL